MVDFQQIKKTGSVKVKGKKKKQTFFGSVTFSTSTELGPQIHMYTETLSYSDSVDLFDCLDFLISYNSGQLLGLLTGL